MISGNTPKILSMVCTMLFILSGLLIFTPGEEVTVTAEEAATADAAGYTWIDSENPDPKVEYDWMDITQIGTPSKTKFSQSYQYRYYLYPMDFQNIGFDFPFYGQTFDKIQPYPNGVLGFGSTQYGYAIYNPNNPLPNSYYYTPEGTIAPYWIYYGGPLVNDDTSDVWIYQGETTDDPPMKFWAITYAKIDYYYYNYEGATFQAILYENGDIKFNILESGSNMYSTSKTYLTIGICNFARDVGTSYSFRNSNPVNDKTGILFKQFKTEVREVEWTEGYGIDQDIYPAMAGMGETDYSAKARVWCEKGAERFTTLDMIIGPASEGIVFRYDFATDTFRKMNDPMRMAVLKEDFCSASPYKGNPDFEVVVEFRYDFNLNWQSLDHTTIRFQVSGDAVKGTFRDFENQFRVVSHVKMVGNLTVEDGRGRELIKGDWVRGGDTLHFYGLERRYADDAIPIQPPDTVKIGIKDIPGKIYTGEETSNLDTYVYVDPVFGEMDYRLIFINVTPEADESDDTKVKVLYTNGFLVQIDSDNPGIPGRVDILPDDKNDKPRNYDNDRDIFFQWEDAIDQSSGVVRYYYSINKPKDRATDAVPIDKSTGSNVAEVKNLPQGRNRIYLWAEDLVGNQGNEVFVEVTIDLEGVTFGGFYPTTDVWNTQIRPTCSVFINDTLTGVDPLSIEYEISTSSVGFSENWQNIQDSYSSAESLRVVVTGFFKNGKDNWIRFRAQDLAGNKYQVSDAYNVWVDAEQPKFDLVSHSEDTYHLTPTQEVRVMITDKESGVDASSIEYRLTTKGITDWTPWRTYKEGVDGKSVEVRITETFRRGDQNFIQVRAKDLAGNPIRTSDAFNIRINTFPEAVVTSPSSGDILYDDTDIVFDASDSVDTDGDKLTFTWYYSKGDDQVKLADVARYITPLDIGEYTITLVVKDRMDNEVQRNFVITVEKRPSEQGEDGVIDPKIDTDGDGIKDWYEIRYKLDHLVKDAGEDPDGDGYTNAEEFGNGRWYGENLTNPKDPRSHPVEEYEIDDKEEKGPFSSTMLPLWGILILLILVVIVTMGVVKNKKDKQVKRIKTVRNMRRIMPSVSWDQITTTAYMAPYVQGQALQAASGPALPTASPEVDPQSALPPAQQAEQEANAAAQPYPAPAQPEPQPAPQPQPFQPPQQ